MKSALIFLAVCVLAAAMVPRDRRAVNSEEHLSEPTTTGKPKQYCAPRTPCAWSTYKSLDNFNKMIDVNITNTYCDCSPDTECMLHEDDKSISAYVYRCRLPGSEDDEAVES